MACFHPLEDFDFINRILPKISFFGGLDDEQLAYIFSRLESAEFSQGEIIGRPGTVPSHIHVIQEGAVDLLISHDQRLVRKRQFTVGDCFGEAALLSLINDTATFTAAGPTSVASLSRLQLLRLHSEKPDIFFAVNTPLSEIALPLLPH